MKRNISSNFYPQTDLSKMQEWIADSIRQALDERSKFKQKIRINICFDPDKKGSLIPKGFL